MGRGGRNYKLTQSGRQVCGQKRRLCRSLRELDSHWRRDPQLALWANDIPPALRAARGRTCGQSEICNLKSCLPPAARVQRLLYVAEEIETDRAVKANSARGVSKRDVDQAGTRVASGRRAFECSHCNLRRARFVESQSRPGR